MNSFNEYVVSSNNSINENEYNAKKARSTIHQLKQLIKSLLRKTKKNTYKKEAQPEYLDNEVDENMANELLEARIMEEIDACSDFSAVPVYQDGKMDILPILRGQSYIPVNFARTEAGTFFWTSVFSADSDICYEGDKNAISGNQHPELQVPGDRWAQA